MKTSAIAILVLAALPVVAKPFLPPVSGPGQSASNQAGIESYEQKLARLESFNIEQREELRRKKRQFDGLSETEKEQLAVFHLKLKTHPNAKQLIRVMKRYHDWLDTVDGQTQSQFLDLPAQQRIAKIRDIKRQQALEAFGRVGPTQLPTEDAKYVFNWFEKITEKKIGAIQNRLRSPPFREEFYRRMSADTDFRSRLRSLWRGGPVAVALEVDPEFVADLVYEDIDELRTLLSFDANQILEQLSEDSRKQLVLNWYAAVQEAKVQGPTDDELERFAESLPQSERNRLYSFSPQGYKTEVLRLWRRSNQRNPDSSSLDGTRSTD